MHPLLHIISCGEDCEPSLRRGSHNKSGRGNDQMQHQDYWMALKDFEMGSRSTACSEKCTLQMKKSTSTHRQNQDMNNTAHPPFRAPSRYRRRSFERRGAMNHLMGQGATSYHGHIHPSVSLQCPSKSFPDQSNNIAVTPTSTNTALSDTSTHASVLAPCEQHVPSSRDLYRSNLTEERGDRFPFHAQQLRKEWKLQRSLIHMDQRRNSSPPVLYETVPTSSRHDKPTSCAVPDTNTAKYSVDGTKNCSSDAYLKYYLSAPSLGDVDASAGSLLNENFLAYSIIAPDRSVRPLLHGKAESSPNLVPRERDNFARATYRARLSHGDLLRGMELRESSCTDANVSTSSRRLSITLRKELATPIVKRLSRSGEALSKMVNKSKSFLSLEAFKKKDDDSNNRNLLFEEMKEFDEQNLLNFVKGKDAYYTKEK